MWSSYSLEYTKDGVEHAIVEHHISGGDESAIEWALDEFKRNESKWPDVHLLRDNGSEVKRFKAKLLFLKELTDGHSPCP